MTTATLNKTHQAAAELVEAGISVVPVGFDKIAAVKWKHLQKRLPTSDELAKGEDHDLAVVSAKAPKAAKVVDDEEAPAAEAPAAE